MKQSISRLVVLHSLPIWLPRTSPWLFNQVRLLPADVENHIVCERTAHLDQFDMPNLHSLDRGPFWRCLLDKGLRRLGARRHLGLLVQVGREQEASIIHSHWGDTAWRDMRAAKRLGARHVVTFYGKDVNYLPSIQPAWRDLYEELFAHIDLVLCEGPHLAACVCRLGCRPEKVRMHRLGVEVRAIPFRPRKYERGEPLRVLIAASFREKKGIPDAVEALGQIKDDVPLHLTIVGDASNDPRSGPEKERILATIAKHDLRTSTRLLGYQPYSVVLQEAYRHHIFLSPSLTAGDGDTEGGAPVTLIDVMATGMPVVSTRHCDIPSVVLDGRTGLLAEERDPKGLAERLRWLVSHPEAWARMVTEGRRRVEAEFDAARQALKLRELYASLLEPSTRTKNGTDGRRDAAVDQEHVLHAIPKDSGLPLA
jgi:colanic acid/amylovoran biosynthesis glycosyltransferase